MSTQQMTPLNGMVRHLRRAAMLQGRYTLSDGRLVEAFLTGRDEAAFEILVKRHGPMVLSLCRRVLRNVQDAEDAFQAVFLVLARKAGSIVPREHVGNWLYGVAYRTALQARTKLSRRRARELQVNDMPHPTVAPGPDLSELHEVLDRELSKLPDKYRLPIVLCDLEGRSRKDVAAQFKIPEGTLSSRLATGRQRLARRLAHYGLTFSGGALAATLSRQAASAAMQPRLLAATVKAGLLSATGHSTAGVISTQVLALSQGVLKTMLLHKLRIIAAIVLSIVVGGAGIGVVGVSGGAGTCAVQAAQPQQHAEAQRSTKDDQEPIDGGLLMDKQIQQELRLSKNQVKRLQAVSRDAESKSEPHKKEIEAIKKKIAELEKQIAKLQASIGSEQNQIAKTNGVIANERTQALSKAAPQILSARALNRVRQIQRQQRGLRELLQDARVQSMLKVDDEQLMKIDEIIKKQPAYVLSVQPQFLQPQSPQPLLWSGTNLILADGSVRMNAVSPAHDFVYYGSSIPALTTIPMTATPLNLTQGQSLATYWINAFGLPDPATDRQLLDVLSDAQKNALFAWLGEPYGPQWRQLWSQLKQK